jgi:hypothetical protein
VCAVFIISILLLLYFAIKSKNRRTGNGKDGCVCVCACVILFSETMKQILITFGIRGVKVSASVVVSKMLFDSYLCSMPLYV